MFSKFMVLNVKVSAEHPFSLGVNLNIYFVFRLFVLKAKHDC